MQYRESWDLSTIPADLLKAEHSRRVGSLGGRPRRLEPCPRCQRKLSARERAEGCPCGHRFPRKARSRRSA